MTTDHGRIDGIYDCPACGVPCHVVDGIWPAHDCTD